MTARGGAKMDTAGGRHERGVAAGGAGAIAKPGIDTCGACRLAPIGPCGAFTDVTEDTVLAGEGKA